LQHDPPFVPQHEAARALVALAFADFAATGAAAHCLAGAADLAATGATAWLAVRFKSAKPDAAHTPAMVVTPAKTEARRERLRNIMTSPEVKRARGGESAPPKTVNDGCARAVVVGENRETTKANAHVVQEK